MIWASLAAYLTKRPAWVQAHSAPTKPCSSNSCSPHWAASTAAFLVLVIFTQRRAVSWPHRLARLLPSVWLIVAFALPTGTEAGHSAALFWFALALTLAGGPYLTWTLLRITLAYYDTLTHRQRRAVVGVVAAVALIAFTLGRLNPLFLTCDDFTVSGNFQPPGCIPGPATFR